jgi:hypothetical protein
VITYLHFKSNTNIPSADTGLQILGDVFWPEKMRKTPMKDEDLNIILCPIFSSVFLLVSKNYL